LLFNLRRWRDEQLTRRCVDFALEPPAPLISHDQTILNCLMADRFEPFDSSYNTFLWPDTPAVAPHARRGRVFHLVGAPKPWNYLGTYANKNATWWYELARETAWGQHWPSRLMSRLGLTREVRLARSTFRALMRR
jgi:lipopolysaccharide biosynthesis glycosyltransferase